ncbi:MAG: hypothetical protein FJY98_04655 [Candidatus Liptonbacteria bacterium]|nr:hypothetical protein [Candidatus Liptonbacteria bacterium]
MYIFFGIAGLLIISWAIWLRDERTQDIGFIAGGICLLVYSASIGDPIFVILQVIFIVSALVEFIKLKK